MGNETSSSLDLDNPVDWLRAKGEERKIALKRAADRLLEVYRLSPRTPGRAINVHRLAALIKAKIVLVKNLRGMGRIMPASGGFQVLVSTGLSYGQFRAVIAHEFAHTLFFLENGAGLPTRLFPPSSDEQKFCIDLSRHILAPEWLLEEAGVFDESDVGCIFSTLTERLGMIRSFASRLILADYELRTGVADRWVLNGSVWELANGHSSVSPSITGSRKREKDFRTQLRKSALRVIEGETPEQDVEVVCCKEKTRTAAFAMVTVRPHL